MCTVDELCRAAASIGLKRPDAKLSALIELADIQFDGQVSDENERVLI